MLSASQLDEAIAVAHRLISDELASGFAEANYFYKVMTQKPHLRKGDGTSITIPINIAENESQGFFSGEYDTVPTNSNQMISHASFDWKFYCSNVTFNLSDFARGVGTNAVRDLIKTKISLAKNSAVRDLSRALHTSSTNAPNSLTSLKDAAGAAGVAYGGINSNDVPSWLFERDTTTNSITYSSINNVFRVLMGRGQSMSDETGSYAPDLMISNAFVQSAFLSSQQSQQQFTTEADLKSGFQGCLFNGIPWQIDNFAGGSGSGVADNELYILSTNTFRMYYKYGFEGEANKSPMDTLSMRLPNQAAVSSQTYMVMNLCNIARRYNAVFTALQS